MPVLRARGIHFQLKYTKYPTHFDVVAPVLLDFVSPAEEAPTAHIVHALQYVWRGLHTYYACAGNAWQEGR
jgi:hypothetical protein